MNFGVTGELGYYLAEQYRKNAAPGKIAGMSFSELAAAGASGRAVGQQDVLGRAAARPDASAVSASGAGTALYMGESYQERLSKITDKNAAAAFQQAYAMKMAGSTDYISLISKTYSTGIVGATNFVDAFSQYDVVTHVGNANISPANWQRNDFPFWKYFQKDTSADALNDWRPVGANPPQTRGDLQRNYSSIGSGRIAILIPESLQQKMDADPAYARQIITKLQEWKEDYDRWDNTVAASYGYNVAEHQAEKNYVFDLDENGDVRNCTVSGGGGKLVGPTKEEQEQFEAEQERKRKIRVKYIQIQEESAERKRLQQAQENLYYFQSQLVKNNLFSQQ
ncbi:MAG: hypothetical protein HFH15_08640 [Ruminococcus sp.]|nr:hypothetical protein [Ruminococcus sp.]